MRVKCAGDRLRFGVQRGIAVYAPQFFIKAEVRIHYRVGNMYCTRVTCDLADSAAAAATSSQKIRDVENA